MIKVYTDITFVTQEFRKIIFPLLFDLFYVKNSRVSQKYSVTDFIDESSIVIVPVEIGYFFKNHKQAWLNCFIQDALRLNKVVWIYSAGDFGITLKEDVYTFRLGGYDSKLSDKTFILPSFIIDPYSILKCDFKPIIKAEQPVISFVGHANSSLIGILKEFLIYNRLNVKRFFKKEFSDHQPFFASGFNRYKLLSKLVSDERVTTKFIFRKKYRAGVKSDEDKVRTTLEFFWKMYHSPYVFCFRGVGNFSVRLYEALAMGRIPVLIDSDCRMPLLNEIQWDEHCIIANEENFIEKLVTFHQNIDKKSFIDIQKKNRELWLTTLKRDDYFLNIYSVFEKNIC